MQNRWMTKPQLAKLAKLEQAYSAATNAVYAAAHPSRDVAFRDCRKLAAPAVVEAHETASSCLDAFQADMIGEGRAYRGTFGRFVPHYPPIGVTFRKRRA